VKRFSELTPCPVEWLWPNRLALGKLAIFDGDAGSGKTFVALDLCARVTTGRPFPDDGAGLPPSPVLIFNSEDSFHDTLLPRLRSFGADLSRICFMEDESDDLTAPCSFPRLLDVLDRTLAQTKARLVVIDPIMGFLDPNIFGNNDQSVRRALYPLGMLAANHRCAVNLIRHLNKSGGRNALTGVAAPSPSSAPAGRPGCSAETRLIPSAA
jgi:RecA-family ATPase